MMTELDILKAEVERLEEHKNYWWRLACGKGRILTKIKGRKMPPEEYYEWVEKYIDDEEAKLYAAIGGNPQGV